MTRPQNKGYILTLSSIWKSIDALLFDFDGVLADSEPFYRKSWNCVLSKYNHVISENDYWKYWSFLGEGLSGEIARTNLIVSNSQSLHEEQKTLYKNYCNKGIIPLFPQVNKIIEISSVHKKCIIASNTDSSLVKKILGSSQSKTIPVIGGNGLPKKPNPDIFLKAAHFIDVPPHKCLVLEDAWKGVEAAKTAGMYVALIRNKYNKNLQAANANIHIPSINSFYQFLKDL